MALTEDSRPFSVLRQSAQEFKKTFEEDVNKCLSSLNSEISALLCDPESPSNSFGDAKRLNAHLEFSKAKYDIFVKTKELFDEIENDWIDHIAEIKATFLENVEIFLAGTKLEVKLPSSNVLSQIERKRSPVSKSSRGKQSSVSSPASSLYPKLFNTARHIPVLNSLLPDVEDMESDEEQQSVATPSRQNGKSKRVTIVTPSEMEQQLAANAAVGNVEVEISDSDEEEQFAQQTPISRGRNSLRLVVTTPSSSNKVPVKSSLRRKSPAPVEQDNGESSSSSSSDANSPLQRRNVKSKKSEVSENINSEQKTDVEVHAPHVEVRGRRSSRSQLPPAKTTTPSSTPGRTTRHKSNVSEIIAVPQVLTPSSTPGRKTRTSRYKSNAPEIIEIPEETPEIIMESEDESINFPAPAAHKSPKNLHFSVGMDINEELDVYSPDAKLLSKVTPRRKTALINQVSDNMADVSLLTPNSARARSKRRTIAGSALDDSVAPSPKRLKRGGRSSIAPSTSTVEANESMGSNFLGSDGAIENGQYSQWVPLSEVGGTVPPGPGIYELKVSAAKKPAYIGGCDNLRQKLTLHKLKQNSGHKHLDKFVDRNVANLLVRYEQLSSAAEAKSQEKIRVKAFVAQYNNPPAYN